MNAISVKNVVKVYESGTKALNGVDLEIKKGDFFALLGANGAGKTTLIGILTGLVNKTSGTAKVFDIDIDKDHNAAKRLMGVVPQEFNFNIFEKVIDIVAQQAGYFGIPRREALKRAEPILKNLDLWEKRDQPARALSGGMKRRLMIARALINDPILLILDEPTAGVDVELRHGMWDYLQKKNKEGTTILLTTHYLEEAEQLCKEVAIIKDGEVVKTGSVKKLIGSLEHQTYVLTVSKLSVEKINGYDIKKIDDNTVEVDVGMHQTVNDLVNVLNDHGIIVQDLRPKGNRLEQLFLTILNGKS